MMIMVIVVIVMLMMVIMAVPLLSHDKYIKKLMLLQYKSKENKQKKDESLAFESDYFC